MVTLASNANRSERMMQSYTGQGGKGRTMGIMILHCMKMGHVMEAVTGYNTSLCMKRTSSMVLFVPHLVLLCTDECTYVERESQWAVVHAEEYLHVMLTNIPLKRSEGS